MKHFGSLQAMSFFAVLFSLSEAFADNPHFTPMSLSPSSFASPSTVKTAGVYWMPDYIGRIGGYGYGNRTTDLPHPARLSKRNHRSPHTGAYLLQRMLLF